MEPRRDVTSRGPSLRCLALPIFSSASSLYPNLFEPDDSHAILIRFRDDNTFINEPVLRPLMHASELQNRTVCVEPGVIRGIFIRCFRYFVRCLALHTPLPSLFRSFRFVSVFASIHQHSRSATGCFWIVYAIVYRACMPCSIRDIWRVMERMKLEIRWEMRCWIILNWWLDDWCWRSMIRQVL